MPRRGLEIGGLLLGRTEPASDTVTVIIDAFEEVPSEHERGPSSLASARDAALLRERLTAQTGSVVGWFRSHTAPI